MTSTTDLATKEREPLLAATRGGESKNDRRRGGGKRMMGVGGNEVGRVEGVGEGWERERQGVSEREGGMEREGG